MENLILPKERMRGGVGGRLREQEEGKEWGRGLECKMRKDSFLKN